MLFKKPSIISKYLINWLDNFYHSLSRTKKRYLLITIDSLLFIISIVVSFWLSFESLTNICNFLWQIVWLLIFKLIVFNYNGMYRSVVRYSGLEFFTTATKSIIYSSGIVLVLAFLFKIFPLPPSLLIIDGLLTVILVVEIRISILWLFHQIKYNSNGNKSPERLIIYGAGVAGSQLARALTHEPKYQVIGFVDDNLDLQQQVVQGFKVYCPKELPQMQDIFDTVILAMPSIEKTKKREIIEHLQALSIFVKTIPTPVEFLSNQVAISQIRNIDVAELLGREEVMPKPELLRLNVQNQVVLVTGAGGSIGSELCRQIAQLQPQSLILYELSEFALYTIDMELAEKYPDLERVSYLGSVTDELSLVTVLKKYQVNTIYHTAAYKHVPLVEVNPAQGVYNNVLGTLITARSAIACGVANFVLISTDKAVRPTNVMGASKRVAELVLQALSDLPNSKTCFGIVRFGNVLDSSGSVVPLFRQQIAQGKPITITDLRVTRYFMSIPEAVRLVIQAGSMATGGEIFLLDMGEPIRIYDLALQMIRLSGLVPDQDIEIKITGLRPGEKLYEELLIDGNNVQPTLHPKIFKAYENKLPWEDLQPLLEALLEAARLNEQTQLMAYLKIIVPEYQPRNSPAINYQKPVVSN